jgi:DNA polymerase-3 subunit gamma/tau
MSYQVLARKYRPSNFQELEGQEHVLRALINALDNNRLHHAYLFTGTRGVGKTTIARILAKCLNCEEGVSSIPCGQCGSCLEIAEGRSVDLIEYDAASRTKVEDTREILDNVQYMPTRNRFKVYLIDEVHMLSNSSFNALLKTLEEPPEHVKFLLATTDPKKLPITVLSRCLQFNLKNITPELVVNYLDKILKKENIGFEEAALWQLGRAADGSMRDALSLTDQAISFGNNAVNSDDVKTMLGSLDQKEVYDLIHCLINKDASGILKKVASLAAFAPDYSLLLSEFLSVLHRVAVGQAVPDGIDNSQGDKELVAEVAGALSREDVQLYYQIGLMGQRDLPFAPEPKIGFEMTLLRMLAFTPKVQGESANPPQKAISSKASELELSKKKRIELAEVKTSQKELDASQKVIEPSDKLENVKSSISQIKVPKSENDTVFDETPDQGDRRSIAKQLSEENWAIILSEMNLTGVTLSLSNNCVVENVSEDSCELVLNKHHASLWNQNHEARISAALSEYIGREIQVKVRIGEPKTETPAEADLRERKLAEEKAVELINNDDNIKRLIQDFDGHLDQDSIKAR